MGDRPGAGSRAPLSLAQGSGPPGRRLRDPARRVQPRRLPISHGEGNYFADPPTLSRLEQHGQVVFRYADERGFVVPTANPNGSVHNIAGIVNQRGNVLGMMPHPERAAEAEVGSADGIFLFRSVMESARKLI